MGKCQQKNGWLFVYSLTTALAPMRLSADGSQRLRAGPNDHTILNGGMAFGFLQTCAAESYPMIDRDVVADLRGLADDRGGCKTLQKLLTEVILRWIEGPHRLYFAQSGNEIYLRRGFVLNTDFSFVDDC